MSIITQLSKLTNPAGNDLFKYLIVYPFVIRGLYLLRQSVEPLYMNATCLMDFVRLSSPEHYDLHPLWKFYQQNTTSTCEDLSGMPIQDFFNHVYKAGTNEFYIFYGIAILYVGICFFKFLGQLFTGKVKSIVSVIAMIILGFNQGSLFHLLSHYQNDLYHLNGNVMHHSSFTVGGDNAALVNTLPPGLIINFIMNFFTVWMMFYVAFDYFKLDKSVYLTISAPAMFCKLITQMKLMHPYIHQHHKSWYGYMSGGFIDKYLVDEYKLHVLCHHVNGYCLGDFPTYSWFYDAMLYYHGKIFEFGYVTFGTAQYYAFNFLLDYFLLSTIIFFAFLTVALFSPFLESSKEKESSKTNQAASNTKVKAH